MKKERKSQKQEQTKNVWKNSNTDFPSDVLGSYTGTPLSGDGSEDPYERPIQDADDL